MNTSASINPLHTSTSKNEYGLYMRISILKDCVTYHMDSEILLTTMYQSSSQDTQLLSSKTACYFLRLPINALRLSATWKLQKRTYVFTACRMAFWEWRGRGHLLLQRGKEFWFQFILPPATCHAVPREYPGEPFWGCRGFGEGKGPLTAIEFSSWFPRFCP